MAVRVECFVLLALVYFVFLFLVHLLLHFFFTQGVFAAHTLMDILSVIERADVNKGAVLAPAPPEPAPNIFNVSFGREEVGSAQETTVSININEYYCVLEHSFDELPCCAICVIGVLFAQCIGAYTTLDNDLCESLFAVAVAAFSSIFHELFASNTGACLATIILGLCLWIFWWCVNSDNNNTSSNSRDWN